MNDKRNGFTLIELLLVIGILGILAVIGLSTFVGAMVKGRDAVRKSDLGVLMKALAIYKNDFGVYPSDDGSGGMVGCMEETGIQTQIACPTADGRWKTKKNGIKVIYLDDFPEDPDTSRKYYYRRTTEGGDDGFELLSALENTQDRDVAQLDGDPDPSGWDVNCGNPSGAPVCNYKLTEVGVVRVDSVGGGEPTPTPSPSPSPTPSPSPPPSVD